MEDRLANGRFAKGHVRRGGRQPGTRNKFTRIRDEFLEVYHEGGGREKLQQLLDDDPRTFFKILASLLPKLKVQENRSLNVDIKDMSMAELMMLAGVPEDKVEAIAVEQEETGRT